MAAWYSSLFADPGWWQAFVGIVQAFVGIVQGVLAFAIFRVTRKYVLLTADLVKLQADVVKLQKQGEQRGLYDRRVKVYDSLMGFLSEFAREMKIDFPPIMQLYRDTREAEFLFGPEIPEFIDHVAKRAGEHRVLQTENVYEAGDQQKINEIQEVEGWLAITASKEAKDKFGRYLRLAESDTPPPGPKGISKGPLMQGHQA